MPQIMLGHPCWWLSSNLNLSRKRTVFGLLLERSSIFNSTGLGFSRFTDHGIDGAVPLELLPPDVRSKYQAKPNDKSKRAKKDESKGAAAQVEEIQIENEEAPH
ncbi:hypothetical protein SO802_008758 [Lithocarpus litseifolius]|uniref:Uncharacterized protein n=1 Tax=Lithocarpus litseifolius TaxID=425828 RepID=A0AAW2DA73_9ROSI